MSQYSSPISPSNLSFPSSSTFLQWWRQICVVVKIGEKQQAAGWSGGSGRCEGGFGKGSVLSVKSREGIRNNEKSLAEKKIQNRF
jgi:hypothetical protein